MRTYKFLFIAIGVFALPFLLEAKTPKETSFSGVYLYLYDYGPPNFGENKKTDAIEKVEYLLLDHPYKKNGRLYKTIQIQWPIGKEPKDVSLGDAIVVEGKLYDPTWHFERFSLIIEPKSFKNLTTPLVNGKENGLIDNGWVKPEDKEPSENITKKTRK